MVRDNRAIAAGPSSQQRRIILVLATAIAIAVGLMLVAGLAFTEDADGIVGLSVVLTPLVAVAFLPLALSGAAFRIAAGTIGIGLMISGVFLLIAVIGILLVPAGVLYVAVAVAPEDWSGLRTATLGFALGAVTIYLALVLLYLLADLVGLY